MNKYFKKTIISTAIPLIGISAMLTATNAFAVFDCTDACRVQAPKPTFLLEATGAGDDDWRMEADVAEDDAYSIRNVQTGRDVVIIENGAPESNLHLDDNGNIGFRTNTPGTDLEIQDALPEIRFDDSSVGGLQMDIGVNQTFMHIEGNGSQDIVHIDANAPANSLFIQPSGDLGIGTNNPDFAVHVLRNNGTAQIKVKEEAAGANVRTLFSLVCETCTPAFRFANNALSQNWFFRMLQNGNFSVDDPGTVTKEAEFKSGGDMLIGGTLTQGSSREIKHNIVAVDSMDILEKVEQLEIARWTYNHNKDDVVHMGPMAEDFYKAFELGDTDKGISSVDTAGVALAAIKALNSERKSTQESLESTKQSLIEKDKKIAELQARMADMETQVAEVQSLKEMLVKYIEQDTNTEFSHVSF